MQIALLISYDQRMAPITARTLKRDRRRGYLKQTRILHKSRPNPTSNLALTSRPNLPKPSATSTRELLSRAFTGSFLHENVRTIRSSQKSFLHQYQYYLVQYFIWYVLRNTAVVVTGKSTTLYGATGRTTYPVGSLRRIFRSCASGMTPGMLLAAWLPLD